MTRTSTWILSRYIISHFDFCLNASKLLLCKKCFFSLKKGFGAAFVRLREGGFPMVSHHFRAIFKPSMSHLQMISFWWVIFKKEIRHVNFQNGKIFSIGKYVRRSAVSNLDLSGMSGQKPKVKPEFNLLRIHISSQFKRQRRPLTYNRFQRNISTFFLLFYVNPTNFDPFWACKG